MARKNSSTPTHRATVLARTLMSVAAACALHGVAFAAAAPPAAPQTFDTTYTAPTGKTITVAAGGDLQAALQDAQLGDTIVLQAGATFTGPYTLPNKTTGSGWIYVVSSNLSALPAPGQRVGPKDAVNMARIVAPTYNSALKTPTYAHHFRFVGIELAATGTTVYQVVQIGGNANTSPETLPHHIVFDRCYVHGNPSETDIRAIEMDGAYIAVVDSYVSDFQAVDTDTQALWAYNTSGPLQIRDNYLEGAGENVMFGGADSRAASLVPADIEIRNNYFFKPLSLLGTPITLKNLLELKSAQRVLVTGNTFQNNPAAAQNGFAILLTPRNQSGTAPWSIVSDVAVVGNTLINVGSGFNIAGRDDTHPSQMTARVLIRNNVVGVTALHGADGRAFQILAGGSNYVIDHNTIVNTSPASAASDLLFAASAASKVSNFVFTNNLATPSKYGFFGNNVGQGTAALNTNFTNWAFAKNVIVGAPAGSYPTDNFYPASVDSVRFVNYAGANYALATGSPYKSAGTDGADIGADLSATSMLNAVSPGAPTNLVVK
jgi:Right handed beta helix region